VKALLTSSSTMSSRSSVLEDARADAGDEEDPELLQVGVAVQSAQHLLRRREDGSRVSVSREMTGRSWISTSKDSEIREYVWQDRGASSNPGSPVNLP
jgi:hypothetical protein